MSKTVKKTLQKFIMFSFLGVFAVLIDWGVFYVMYKCSSWFTGSLAVAWITAMMFNFTSNRRLTFSAQGGRVGEQLPRWMAVQGVAFLCRTLIGKGVLIVLGENVLTANIAFFCGMAVSIPINFAGSNLWAFKKG
jgi:putative flippase GtrA